MLILGSPSLAGKVASRGGNRVVTKSTTLAPLLAVVAVLACSLVSHHHDDDGIPQSSAVTAVEAGISDEAAWLGGGVESADAAS